MPINSHGPNTTSDALSLTLSKECVSTDKVTLPKVYKAPEIYFVRRSMVRIIDQTVTMRLYGIWTSSCIVDGGKHHAGLDANDILRRVPTGLDRGPRRCRYKRLPNIVSGFRGNPQLITFDAGESCTPNLYRYRGELCSAAA